MAEVPCPLPCPAPPHMQPPARLEGWEGTYSSVEVPSPAGGSVTGAAFAVIWVTGDGGNCQRKKACH